jgi:transcriptional regulator with XRE-family HTH domain
MLRFDAMALYQALDAERQARGLSWSELSREIGVSTATMQRLKRGGRLEVDGALAMVGWLRRTVESFARRSDDKPL